MVPPLAPIKYTYDALDCAPGTEDVVIVNGLVGGATALMATFALAFLVLSAELVAVTVTVVFDVTDGAVNMPFPEIVPAEAAHVTDVLLEPCTVATNCCPAPDFTDAEAGETDTLTVGAVAGATLTTELAVLVLSAALVARTVTEVVAETFGAVNMPLPEIVPAEADHVTDVLLEPCTVATNCCPAPDFTDADVGETDTLTSGVAAGTTLTTELALFVLSAELVARTVTAVVLETLGAVKTPALEILPADADQLTAVLLVPCTLAVNCRFPPAVTLVLVGETEMLTLGCAVPATEICSCSVAAISRASLTTTHPELVPAAVGVPLTAPVCGFSARPLGKLPETRM